MMEMVVKILILNDSDLNTSEFRCLSKTALMHELEKIDFENSTIVTTDLEWEKAIQERLTT